MVRHQWGKVVFVLIILFISLCYSGVKSSHAETSKQRVYDYGNILSKQEINRLEEKSAEYSEERKTDFLILTTKDVDKSAEQFMADFYDEKDPGYDKKSGNTVIMTVDVDPKKHDVYISGFKKAEKTLNNDRIELVLDEVVPYLSKADYANAFDVYLDKSYELSGIRFGLSPDNILFKTWFQLVVAVGISGIILGTMLYNTGGKVTVSGRTYNDPHHTRILDQDDRYIRTTVTKTKKPSENNNSGGGGSIGGGMTSGGHSYSGGGRKF